MQTKRAKSACNHVEQERKDEAEIAVDLLSINKNNNEKTEGSFRVFDYDRL